MLRKRVQHRHTDRNPHLDLLADQRLGAVGDLRGNLDAAVHRPGMHHQRVGRGAVIEHAVSEGLDNFYREAVTANEIRIVGRPSAEVIEWPSDKDFSGDLKVEVEVIAAG